MSSHYPFCRVASLLLPAVAAFVLLASVPISPARAQAVQPAQQATLSDTAKSDAARPPAPPPGGTAAAAEPANPQQKSLTTKAIDKVKEVAKSAGDIFSRVPCLPPKGGVRKMASLPRVASELAAGEPVVIV